MTRDHGPVAAGHPAASVLVPAYREADGIRLSLHRIAAALKELDRYVWDCLLYTSPSPRD